MNNKPHRSCWTGQSLVIILSVATLLCAYLPAQGLQEDAKFMAIEKDGAKMWQGGGTINLKAHGTGPLTFKLINTLALEHGFAIDTMMVKEVIKPGEEKIIDVPLANSDKATSVHRAYCHLHPKHVAAAFVVTMK